MVIYPYSTCKHISVGKHSQLSSLHLLLFFPLVSSIVASSACSSFSPSFQPKQSRTKFEAQIKAFIRLGAKHLFGVQSINIHKSLCYLLLLCHMSTFEYRNNGSTHTQTRDIHRCVCIRHFNWFRNSFFSFMIATKALTFKHVLIYECYVLRI